MEREAGEDRVFLPASRTPEIRIQNPREFDFIFFKDSASFMKVSGEVSLTDRLASSWPDMEQ